MDQAYRITFEVDGDRLTLKAVRKLTMRVPPDDRSARSGDDMPGRFIELRGGKGEPLYRREVGNLIARHIEFPTGDPAQPFGRGPAPGRSRLVSVLVPAEPDGRSVAVVESRLRAERAGRKRAARRRDLISVDLPRDGEKNDGRR